MERHTDIIKCSQTYRHIEKTDANMSTLRKLV